jgi:P-type E1-E2 ATPase
MKGALRTVSEASGLGADAVAGLEAHANEETRRGRRVLALAIPDADRPFKLVGLAFLSDGLRADSRELIETLQTLGVRVKMVTGDALPVARDLARELGLGAIVRAPDLRAALREAKQRAGDGVNDGPARRQAEVGIAVSGATDVAKVPPASC